MVSSAKAVATLRSLHWRRGLRAGISVASAMLVCRLLDKPMGWAALGGFEAVLVDNGGPYRSRMATIATVLFGGAFCGLIGSLCPQVLPVAMLVTAAVCFAVTYGRVSSQPVASTSVIILVLYFAGFGSSDRTLAHALGNVLAYTLGGLWAAVISLFLWPVDPFRPARLEVAACYDLLAEFTATIHAITPSSPEDADPSDAATTFKRQLRGHLETARAALSATAARAPARTIRARNLSVLLETADMLFAATLRLTELAGIAEGGAGPAALEDIAQWLSGAESAIARELRTRPADAAASFAPDGSHRIQHVARRAALLAQHQRAGEAQSGQLLPHLVADERDALQNIEIAFDAVRAVWTGIEPRLYRSPSSASPTVSGPASAEPPVAEAEPGSPAWVEALRQNWTLDSTMLRHALRMAVVGAVDVLLMRLVHVTHGFWLAMTSTIVLQPYGSGTLRRSLERVGGTIAGGIFAALLAAVIHDETGIIVVISLCSVLCLATYAIDYGWYSFFLTPTFVLMSLPYLRDWRYAGIRIVTTILGAAVAVIAMRLLWPQSLSLELSRLLARCASAGSAYIRAVLVVWQSPKPQRAATERRLLAPARRASGLTSQDAEEALDRLILDRLLPDRLIPDRLIPDRLTPDRPIPAPALPTLRGPSSAAPTGAPQKQHAKEHALSFTTYIRRFTQCLTTLAFVGKPTPHTVARLNHLAGRLEGIAATLDGSARPIPQEPWSPSPPTSSSDVAEQMLQRMERQAGVLERAAAGIAFPERA